MAFFFARIIMYKYGVILNINQKIVETERGGIKVTFEELMGAFHDNADVYNSLKAQLECNSIIPIIGAGLSIWAGYPLWGKLLDKVADKVKDDQVKKDVKKLLDNCEYEDAADKLEMFFNENRFMRKVNDVISSVNPDESKRPPFQQQLKKLFKAPFVTTNYDKLLETLLGASFVVNPQDPFNEAAINSHLQNKKHFIIKLHGTVDDPTHMILTKKSYNKVYGDNPEEPVKTLSLPRTLEAIFKSSFPLFLGCSLDKDRTCAVFKNCVGTTGFALVEMPDNKADFDKKDKHLDEMNLQVIWYPHGQHEAVGVLINQLAKDMGIGGDPGSADSSAFEVDEQEEFYKGTDYFVGRDSIVDDIVKKFKNPNNKVLLVHGAPGIGKTEICKAVYRKLKKDNPDFSMPFIDVAETKSIAEFWERLAKGLGVFINDISIEDVFPRIKIKIKKNKSLYAYLDNFEDILNALDESKQKKFLDKLKELSDCGLHLLISSQTSTLLGENIDVTTLDNGINVMEESLTWSAFFELSQVKLFINKYYKYGRKPQKYEFEDFRKLISELEGLPLAIILTASYGKGSLSIKKLLKKWSEIEVNIPGESEKHKSLLRAVSLAWDRIKNDKAAVFRWALHTHSVIPLDEKTLDELNDALSNPFKDWDECERDLCIQGITYKTNDGKERMLLALKKQFPKLGNEVENYLQIAFDAWLKVCKKNLEYTDEDYSYKAITFLPECFYLAENCLDRNDYDKLYGLLRSCEKYYEYDLKNSIPFIERIISKSTDDEFPYRKELTALLYKLNNLNDKNPLVISRSLLFNHIIWQQH